MMTTADRLRLEGEARGERKGWLVGKREVVLRQLRLRFGRLPAATVARIDKAGDAELNTWTDRVVTAESLDEVLGAKARRKA